MSVTIEVRQGFRKAELGGQAYVFPYGQNIVDYCDSMSLNESGEVLWEGIKEHLTREELAELLRREYELEKDKKEELLEDVDVFLKRLTYFGIAEEKQEKFYGWNEMIFAAGPLKVSYRGPEVVFDRYFREFAGEAGEACDLTVQITCMPPRYHKNGGVIIRNKEIILMDVGEEYLFLFPEFDVLYEMQVKKDGSYALLFCEADLMEQQAEDIFHAIRFAFLLAASEKGLFLLHSASFYYRGRAWLFSGKSGTGKSTHTNLWNKYYGVELLNGDLNMLGAQDGKIVVYGQPWCGTSGICSQKSYPLGGIVFLRQASGNRCKQMQAPEKMLALLQRMISPTWEENLLLRNIDFAQKAGQECSIWQLYCTPEREAAEVMKKEIDHVCDTEINFPKGTIYS